MPLETATYVDDLVITNPASGDNALQGDDHLRLLKEVLKTTFPNADRAMRRWATSAKSSAFNADTDMTLYLVDATGGAVTASLPDATTAGDGFVVAVKKLDASANAVTVDAAGADTIDGAANDSIASQYGTMIYVSDNANWVKLIATSAAGISNTPAGGVAATSVQAAINELDGDKAKLLQTFTLSGMILGALSNRDYRIMVKIPFGGTITETVTRLVSGTATVTFKVNTTALGGSAHSASSTENAIARASSNTFVADDDIVITVASTASAVDLSFTIEYTRNLAAN